MKTLFIIGIVGLLSAPAFAQDDSTTVTNIGVVSVTESPDGSVVSVGPDGSVVIDEKQDTTRIKIGKKGIVIIEGEKGTQINIEEPEEEDMVDDNTSDLGDCDDDEESNEDDNKFKPHWAGLEVGINNYLNSNMSMSHDNYMDLNTGRSWNFNINFMDYGFGLGSNKIGLVTGLGLEWNNYHFDGENNIQKNAVSGIIEEMPLTYSDLQKTKMQSTYLRAPLLLEFHIPAGKKHVYISAGPVAGVKLGSNTKIEYKENGDKQNIKDKDDYNLSALRYGFTARAGYKGLRLFANYYMTPLFESGKGPELYPFSVGLTLLEF